MRMDLSTFFSKISRIFFAFPFAISAALLFVFTAAGIGSSLEASVEMEQGFIEQAFIIGMADNKAAESTTEHKAP